MQRYFLLSNVETLEVVLSQPHEIDTLFINADNIEL